MDYGMFVAINVIEGTALGPVLTWDALRPLIDEGVPGLTQPQGPGLSISELLDEHSKGRERLLVSVPDLRRAFCSLIV